LTDWPRLWTANVDTDQIIPNSFSSASNAPGYGEFFRLCIAAHSTGEPDPGFVLNDPRVQWRAMILIRRQEFRVRPRADEHGRCALSDLPGFRAVIAPTFA